MTVIREDDLVVSVADAAQCISCYHDAPDFRSPTRDPQPGAESLPVFP
jgi:hypothetical protein